MNTTDVYNEIVSEVQSQDEFNELLPDNDNSQKLLDDVTSKSKVDPWRSIAWIIATILTDFRILFDKFKNETATVARNNRVGTIDWWLQSAYEFQFGDNLQVISGRPYYQTIVEANRVVSNASHQVTSGINLIKVVKGTFPDFQKLSTEEASSLIAYFRRIAPPGINFSVISSDAEEIKIEGNVYYNGLKDLDDLKLEVESKIDSYIKYLPNEGEDVVFNGSFVRNELIDQVREIDGVNDFELIDVVITSNGVDKQPLRVYQPISGYMRIKDSEPLSSTLNYYTANV